MSLFARKFTFHSRLISIANMSSTKAPANKRNIEIKARFANESEFEKRVAIAKELTKSNGEIIPQHDVFFKVPNGRLKLRYMTNGPSMLVQYNRPNIKGPKLSEFNIVNTDDPKMMHKILEASVGVLGEVKKQRLLFWHKQTRIHLDRVEGLGEFLEFEVCLEPTQTIDEGKQIADELLGAFDINENNLMAGAYLDELLANN